MARTFVRMLIVALCACGGSSQDAPPEEPAPSPAPAASEATASAAQPVSALLGELRERIDRAREAADDEHVVTGPIDAGGLVGVQRRLIETALGAPNECALAEQTTCPGAGGPCTTELRPSPAPCEREDDVFYSFYHLPEGSVGGGPELLLRYDASGRCTHAVWRFTQ